MWIQRPSWAFALSSFDLPSNAKGVPGPTVISSLPLHPSLPPATQPHFPPNVARRSGVDSRPRDASRLRTDEGAPATPPNQQSYPGLHRSSSGISPCARLIPAAGSTPGLAARPGQRGPGRRGEARRGEASSRRSGSTRGAGEEGHPGRRGAEPADPVWVPRPPRSWCLPQSRAEEAEAAGAQ